MAEGWRRGSEGTSPAPWAKELLPRRVSIWRNWGATPLGLLSPSQALRGQRVSQSVTFQLVPVRIWIPGPSGPLCQGAPLGLVGPEVSEGWARPPALLGVSLRPPCLSTAQSRSPASTVPCPYYPHLLPSLCTGRSWSDCSPQPVFLSVPWADMHRLAHVPMPVTGQPVPPAWGVRNGRSLPHLALGPCFPF